MNDNGNRATKLRQTMKEIKSIQAFNDLVQQDKPILIDFYADWCGPCKALTPTVERLADKYTDTVEVVKVNVDTQPTLAQQFNVRSIPTLFFVHDRTIKERLQGVQSEAVLDRKLHEYSQLGV